MEEFKFKLGEQGKMMRFMTSVYIKKRKLTDKMK